MADKTKIEWTDATWNPIRGCTRVSEGCRNCYAEVMAARFSDPGQWGHGLAKRVTLPGGGTDHRWTGKVQLIEDKLDQPLRWRRPRMIFVNSTSDLFHEAVPDEWIDRVFAVMALAKQHTFQVLTKRPERARKYLTGDGLVGGPEGRMTRVEHRSIHICGDWPFEMRWPLPNVWLGTSVEDQATADERIPHLLATPATVRFVSAEPLLGAVDLGMALPGPRVGGKPCVHWVIVGGESGPGARPMHPDWARSLRDQCQAAGVAFFFKQWGEWAPVSIDQDPDYGDIGPAYPMRDCTTDWGAHHGDKECLFWQGDDMVHWPYIETFPAIGARLVGKRAAGRLLDGRKWNQMPEATP